MTMNRLVAATSAVVAGAMVASASSPAQTVMRVPFSTVFFNQCAAGESLNVTGTLVIVSRSHDGHTIFNFALAGAKAVAPSTGAEYVVTLRNGGASYVEPDGTPFVMTIGQHIRLVRLGEDASFVGDDFVLRALFHITTTPDGTVAVNFDRSEVTCF